VQTRQAIHMLVAFGLKEGLLEPLDAIWSENALLDIMQEAEPWNGEIDNDSLPPTATPILKVLLDAAVSKGFIEDTPTERDLFDTRLMSTLLPKPSTVAERFDTLYRQNGIQAATNWFYHFCRASDYIRVDMVARNIAWDYKSDRYGELAITINMTKPEKDPREIAKLRLLPPSSYPSCMLCKTNMGYAGRMDHPNRQTLRILPITLCGEQWYFQYSPYVYYDQHCIVFKDEHTPMRICDATFIRFFDFLDIMPHYFIGSNAGLPVVGGSILNHDHFQGGVFQLPMAKAQSDQHLVIPGHSEVDASILRWPMSVVRLTGGNRAELEGIASTLLHSWEEWSDAECGILARDPDGTMHNTFTPIARIADGKYQLDLVLRNNVTSEQHPLGVFHPHKELHHIKRENIGLIEVMGLFILPGRLNTELSQVEEILSGQLPYDEETLSNSAHPLNKHLPWIQRLVSQYGTQVNDSQKIVREEVGSICVQVLRDAGVYKDTPDGRRGMLRWLADTGVTTG
jgi:UDPglucose--hexose-1-phosphate uridylyltransferase